MFQAQKVSNCQQRSPCSNKVFYWKDGEIRTLFYDNLVLRHLVATEPEKQKEFNGKLFSKEGEKRWSQSHKLKKKSWEELMNLLELWRNSACLTEKISTVLILGLEKVKNKQSNGTEYKQIKSSLD